LAGTSVDKVQVSLTNETLSRRLDDSSAALQSKISVQRSRELSNPTGAPSWLPLALLEIGEEDVPALARSATRWLDLGVGIRSSRKSWGRTPHPAFPSSSSFSLPNEEFAAVADRAENLQHRRLADTGSVTMSYLLRIPNSQKSSVLASLTSVKVSAATSVFNAKLASVAEQLSGDYSVTVTKSAVSGTTSSSSSSTSSSDDDDDFLLSLGFWLLATGIAICICTLGLTFLCLSGICWRKHGHRLSRQSADGRGDEDDDHFSSEEVGGEKSQDPLWQVLGIEDAGEEGLWRELEVAAGVPIDVPHHKKSKRKHKHHHRKRKFADDDDAPKLQSPRNTSRNACCCYSPGCCGGGTEQSSSGGGDDAFGGTGQPQTEAGCCSGGARDAAGSSSSFAPFSCCSVQPRQQQGEDPFQATLEHVPRSRE